MQRCSNCNEKFKYMQIMKAGNNGYKPIACGTCGQNHKVTLSSRLRVALSIMVYPLLVVFDVIRVFRDNIFMLSLIVFLLTILIILMLPYLIRVKK